jgi:transposase InsO family protein
MSEEADRGRVLFGSSIFRAIQLIYVIHDKPKKIQREEHKVECSYSLSPLRHKFTVVQTLFTSLAHARAVLLAWKDDYNNVRSHSGLGNLAPSIYA